MDEAVMEVADEKRGPAFSAPNNAAVKRAIRLLGSLKNDRTALAALNGNYVSIFFLFTKMLALTLYSWNIW
jgi:hypothetical protein